jgi:hypothetical protein
MSNPHIGDEKEELVGNQYFTSTPIFIGLEETVSSSALDERHKSTFSVRPWRDPRGITRHFPLGEPADYKAGTRI